MALMMSTSSAVEKVSYREDKSLRRKTFDGEFCMKVQGSEYIAKHQVMQGSWLAQVLIAVAQPRKHDLLRLFELHFEQLVAHMRAG
jgi:hypothetical protein